MSQHVSELDTPCVAIDLPRVERNLREFQIYLDQHGIANRPHIKTHKLIEMTRRQLDLGAKGIACQKLSEAAAMADCVNDILIPYNIVGAAKLPRALELARKVTLTLACDSLATAEPLAAAFDSAGESVRLIVEVESGAGRVGVPNAEAAVDLAQAIDRLPGASFEGLMTYPPAGVACGAGALFEEIIARLATSGIASPIVSYGGTPDMWRAHEQLPAITEHRAGTYIYFDRMQVQAGACSFEDCALAVIATVVSIQGDHGAIDAGSKALTSDLGGLEGHGLIVEYPDISIAKLSEEHGHLDLSQASKRPVVGDRLTIIPNHVCPVSNLFDRVYGLGPGGHKDGIVEEIFTVAARGAVT